MRGGVAIAVGASFVGRAFPFVALPCAAAVREWMPAKTQRMNGKAVRSHSGERTACIYVSGTGASEHFTFEKGYMLSRQYDLLIVVVAQKTTRLFGVPGWRRAA